MRKIYETSNGRSMEHNLFYEISTKMDCICITTPQLCAVDGLICRLDGSLWCLAEIKIRANHSNKYKTYLLSSEKHKNIIDMSIRLRVPALLIVKFTDCVMATTLRDNYLTSSGGRLDRNDIQDIELCAYIPMSEFRLVL